MYVPYQSDELWNALLDAAKSGIESGLKSVVKDILSTVGEALLEYFSPAIADLFFNSDESDAATQRIVDEIRDTHSDLADRHREMFEEMQDMYSADITGSFETAFVHLVDWISHSDPIVRMETLGDLPVFVMDRFTNVRTALEAYILRQPASDACAQFQRLQLLSLHIEATRLELTTRRLYWNWRAIQTTFEFEHGDTSTSTIFEEWRDSLSQEQMDDIQDIADGNGSGVRLICDQALSFYETLSNRDDLSNYVEAIFTPLVGHMETFNGNPNMYDNEDVVNDEANWGTPDEPDAAVARLDGMRWYYYVDVPRAECLEGYAYRRGLSDCHYPWAEVPDEPSQSDCNRYWIVNPHTSSTADPEYCPFRASFDAYDMWFANSMDIYDMHKELVKGDFLRTIYGPSLMILDAMYTEIYGRERPANRWDEALARYDELVGLLGAGRSYEEAVEASEALLDRCGVSPEDPGLFIWYEMLKMEVEDPLNPPLCPDTFEKNNTWEKAAQIEPGYYNHMNLNVPADIDIYQFELLANNSVLIDLDYDETAFTSPPVVELWGQLPDEDEPSLIESASEHEEYGLSILLPRRSGRTYRHRKMTAFVKVYSPDNQTGEYAIAIETKGPELRFYRDFDLDSSDSSDLTRHRSGTIFPAADTMITMIDVGPYLILRETGAMIDVEPYRIVRETGDEPYRIEPESEPESTEESDSGLSISLNEYRTIALISTIYTGGDWIKDRHQTVFADIDRYVVEVPPGLALEISIIPSNPNFGMPYAEFEDRALLDRATVDYSQWPEGGHTIKIWTTGYELSRDVFFKVSGFYSNNYRRDTGTYRLTVTVEGTRSVWYELGRFHRAVLDDVRQRIPSPHDIDGGRQPIPSPHDIDGGRQPIPSHHDIRDLSPMDVELGIVKVPDNPGDPFVLAAIDYGSGSVINYYKFNPSEYKSDLPFRMELKAFNKAQMGRGPKL